MYGFFIGAFKVFVYLTLPFIVFSLSAVIYYRFMLGYKFKKGTVRPFKQFPLIFRLLVQFPFRFIKDKLTFDPDFFQPYGVHIIAGEQGSGKTITLVYLLKKYQYIYPKLVVKTNMLYKFENSSITHWRDVVASNNGIYGEIDVLDEIQNWFSSLQSKDFPPEMLTEITQQRKQRKMIIGTSQVFSRVAKPIREQTTFLYEPVTLFGCLTWVRVYKPIISADGNMDNKHDKKLRGMFFFVHTDSLRDSFDTYKKIEKISEEGFVPSPFANSNATTTVVLKDK